MITRLTGLTGLLSMLAACGSTPSRDAAAPTETAMHDGVVASADGTKIHYLEGGRGTTTLFFLHGWLGNAHWWDEQFAHFSPRYRVVAIDQAGHGESGRDRKAWTMQACAQDARAVADKLGLDRVVWIGHSMSGGTILELANLLPERTVGLIPIDILEDVGQVATTEEKAAFFGALEKDFPTAVRAVFKEDFPPGAPEPVVRRVLDEAAAAPPAISIPILRAFFDYDAASAMRKVKAPIVAVNSEMHRTNVAGNRKFAPQFDVVLMKNVGHWPMLERPGEFDLLLQQAIDRATAKLR
ncbi:alpha/beta hydrolase [Pendulispora rubella]|uniref:Alpha/beta hydrolase n=1 Tax=Pendulispora rubella TaxID=2741070 RepID=A0ABZ2LBS6_9BACT